MLYYTSLSCPLFVHEPYMDLIQKTANWYTFCCSGSEVWGISVPNNTTKSSWHFYAVRKTIMSCNLILKVILAILPTSTSKFCMSFKLLCRCVPLLKRNQCQIFSCASRSDPHICNKGENTHVCYPLKIRPLKFANLKFEHCPILTIYLIPNCTAYKHWQ